MAFCATMFSLTTIIVLKTKIFDFPDPSMYIKKCITGQDQELKSFKSIVGDGFKSDQWEQYFYTIEWDRKSIKNFAIKKLL